MWLSTGFGKSLCYDTLPFLYDWKLGRVDSQSRSLVLVILPLMSLMVDQVLSLRCLKAAIITSGDSVDAKLLAREDDLRKYSLLVSAAEALVGSRWRETLTEPVISDRIVSVVISETPCVSHW